MKPVASFFNAPLALHEIVAREILALTRPGAGVGDFSARNDARKYGFFEGVAVIPIQGVLAPDVPWWADGTSYSWIRAGFDAALVADDVQAIVFDVNSPGGTVEGCFDLVDHIYQSRGTKPIWSILSENAYSAAYALASAADQITVPRTGGAGSIGVVAMHVDVSKYLEDVGIKVTYFQHGARKTDGVSEKPLSDEAISCFSSEVNEMGELFIATVARNRKIDADKIRKMEAGTFLGADAVKNKLCDQVLAPNEAFSQLLETLS